MSYRTFKHLLGETSLERKCRFIFGGGILALVTLSFSWYGTKTESLVIGQKTEAARVRVEQTLTNLHMKVQNPDLGSFVDELSGEKSVLNLQPRYESYVFEPYPRRLPENRPRDEFEAEALARFLSATAQPRPTGAGERPILDSSRTIPGKRQYQYVQAIFLKPNCLNGCHDHQTRPIANGQSTFANPGDLAGIAVVKLPMELDDQGYS